MSRRCVERFRSILGWHCASVMLALAIAPAAGAQAPILTNDYNLWAFGPPYEAQLSSFVDCGIVRCDIGYRVWTNPIDRLVKVTWKDTGGKTLISASNDTLSRYFGTAPVGIDATEWSKGAFGSAAVPITPPSAVGTADFTGTSPGPDPCGIGYVCNDADYYFWPKSVLNPTPGGGAGPGSNQRIQPLASTAVPVGTIIGRLANVGIDPSQPGGISERVTFLEFASTVELDGAQYRYRYSLTNFTDLVVPFTWAEAGLSGEVQPFDMVLREATSPLGPEVFSSIAAFTLEQDDPFPSAIEFANSLELYAPVPEPSQWLQLAAGMVAVLALVRRRRRERPGMFAIA